ncbi:MAG: cation-translocating P-type ATPase [Streptosporangiaceae bacterium]|nr:cation-translocating P-type ATPase [Streptosporangiaceae bacterium]
MAASEVAGAAAEDAAGAARDAAAKAAGAARDAVERAAEAADAARETVGDPSVLTDLGTRRSRRQVWSRAGHAAIEVRGLAAGKGRHVSSAVRGAVAGLPGVRWAEVNMVTAQVLVAFDEQRVDVGQILSTVRDVEKQHGTHEDEFSWSLPDHPASGFSLAATWAALAGDVAGMGAGIAGRLGRIPPLPAAFRVPLAVLDGYPRLRGELEKRIGPIGADVLLAVGNAAAYGFSEGPARPAVDAAYRLLLITELRARMAAWTERGTELTIAAARSCRDTDEDCDPGEQPGTERPGTGQPGTGQSGGDGTRRLADRPCPYPAGPIETYTNRTAAGTLAAAGAVLAATRNPGRGAEAIGALVPKAARLGREGFAAVLGRDLARRGVVPMDRSAFRRLDRTSVVLIDSAVLIGTRPQVLSAEAADDGDEATVWRAADSVLSGCAAGDLRGPGPWEKGGHRLARVQGPPGPDGARRQAQGENQAQGQDHHQDQDQDQYQGPEAPDGLRLSVLTPEGQRLGEVTVGCEPDPLAEAVLTAARDGGARLLVTRHASLADLVGRADEVVDDDLTAKVRALQADGEGVLLLCADDDPSLDAADVAVGYVAHGLGRPVRLSADLICGPGLAEVWRLLRAMGQARPVSERSVSVAAAGATLGVLHAAARRPGGTLPVSPVHAAALTSLVLGGAAGYGLTRGDPPAPAPRTAWHAMSADDVLARLEAARDGNSGGGDRAEPEPRGAEWRRRLDALAATPVFAPVAATARAGADLATSVFSELKDPLTPILLTGSAASAMLGSGVDAGLVSGVMVGNALVGGLQRQRTERALRDLLLREQQSARRVRRAPGDPLPGDPDEAGADLVPAATLRPGDVIALRSDDVVPADARLLAADSLEVDESTLTGESLPVTKDPAPTVAPYIAERTSMVYEGTTVVSGSALAVVVAVGEATEAGRAGAAASVAAPAAGISAHLSDLTSKALPATGAGGLAVTALGMLRGVPLREALAAGVAVAVAAVPEGLPLVSTMAQLAAARRLSKRGVLVRSPRTLEALGRLDVICFDKTGTLTEGRLRVRGVAAAEGDVDLGGERGRRLLRVAARACPVPGEGRIRHATDQAILDAVRTGGDEHAAGGAVEDQSWELIEELPFENNRGYAAALGRAGGRLLLAVKGAPEILLDECSRAEAAGEEAHPMRFTAELRRAAGETIHRLAGRGLRVLAVAERDLGTDGGDHPPAAELVHDLTLLGFVTIADVMRPDAADVVRHLAGTGVRPVMITGDHPETASAIAGNAGIPDAADVVTGPELDRLPERERRERVSRSAVFARITPEQKLRIVSDLRRAGRVVAMVGDGANDAAAIRSADVGIGITARGSTAARNASDLVLGEGSIGQIGDAVREGRALWRSVRDAVSILVGGNAGEIAFMVLGTALGGRSPLNTRQLLLVNMLTDMFPALAVAGTEPRDGGEEPVPAAPMLTGPLGKAIMVRGGATALGGTLAWAGGRLTGRSGRAATMGLAGIVTTQLAQTMLSGARSPVVIITTVASAGALVLVVNTPGVSQFFGCTPLGPAAWAMVGASAATATVASVIAPRLVPGLRPGAEVPAEN